MERKWIFSLVAVVVIREIEVTDTSSRSDHRILADSLKRNISGTNMSQPDHTYIASVVALYWFVSISMAVSYTHLTLPTIA